MQRMSEASGAGARGDDVVVLRQHHAAQSQVDIAVAALRCGMTHVVNFYIDPDTLLTDALHGVIGGHHGASHDSSPASVDSILNAHRWSLGYLFDFLAKHGAGPNE